MTNRIIEHIAEEIKKIPKGTAPSLKWEKSSSKFKYNGTPVERHKAKVETPLGTLRVYEAVNGRAFMEYFYIGYDLDSNRNKIPQLRRAKMPCVTIEIGVLLLERKWKELKKQAFDL